VLCIGEPEENTDWHGYNGCARMVRSIPSAAARMAAMRQDSAHLRQAQALAEVGQALRAGSTQVPLAHGQDNRHASPAGASMRSGRASARCAPAPQGLPRAQGGLQPAAPQPRRGFHALREGFSPLRPSPAGASTRSGRASARCAPAPQGLPRAQGGLMVFE
jgi:hypothetical protein